MWKSKTAKIKTERFLILKSKSEKLLKLNYFTSYAWFRLKTSARKASGKENLVKEKLCINLIVFNKKSCISDCRYNIYIRGI